MDCSFRVILCIKFRANLHFRNQSDSYVISDLTDFATMQSHPKEIVFLQKLKSISRDIAI